MGKHFVTVCVFCLLCATHSPCSSHVQLSTTNEQTEQNRQPVKKTVFDKITDRYSPTSDSVPWDSNSETKLRFNNVHKRRTARDVLKKQSFDETVFLTKIFNTFGNGETINREGFERLIKSLHLDRLLWSKINNAADSSTSVNKIAANTLQNDSNSMCMDHRDLIKSISSGNSSSNTTEISINEPSFRRLCPILLYQLVAPSSAERQGCVKVPEGGPVSQLNSHHHTDLDMLTPSIQRHAGSNIASVWLYSTLSIIIISACGLLGVLVIPVMQQHFYQHLIQFLIALAVGTLAGDALLHLMPHAMINFRHADEHDHDLKMWRGFAAMIGLIFFYFMEKCLTLGAEWRKQRQLRKNKIPARVRVMRETDTTSTTSVGCKHKYSSYPYCYGVIATETQDDHHTHSHSINNHPVHNSSDASHNNTATTMIHELDSDSELVGHGHSHLETNQNQCVCRSASAANQQRLRCAESSKMLAEIQGTLVPQDQYEIHKMNNQLPESESYTVILRTHENKHHGHSHTHGHVHSAPKTMSSVAWMVVMGDGLHNFTDGMTIGAAFAGSLAGGFSTAVAVFCHELPHELGDFAVLLKAGMTARQAVFYNMLSSVLCMFGMVLGVVLGNSDEVSGWIFALAAGMFIYIALVDMVPELTTSHSKEGGSFLQCILQFFGLLSGLVIMLLIAMYEHDLKHLFED